MQNKNIYLVHHVGDYKPRSHGTGYHVSPMVDYTRMREITFSIKESQREARMEQGFLFYTESPVRMNMTSSILSETSTLMTSVSIRLHLSKVLGYLSASFL